MTTDGLSTAEVVPPAPRRVVPADEADARIRGAALEVEELEARLRQLEAELAAAPEQGYSEPADDELPESAQLTLRFVDDLVSTNRERIRDLLAERYAWAGDRLVDAHVEAQAIVNEALSELNVALRERDADRTDPRDQPLVAELLASIAPPATATEPTPEPSDPDPAVDLDAPAEALEDPVPLALAVAEPDGPLGIDLDDSDEDEPEDDHEDGDDEEPAVQGAHFVKPAAPALSPDALGPAASVDDVVSSAVQAVLRALTEPGADREPPVVPDREPQLSSLGPVPEPTGDLQPPSALAGGRAAAGPAMVATAPDVDDDDAPAEQFEEFWSDQPTPEAGQRSRFRPRHVVVAMLLLVVAVLVALALIG